MAQHTLELPDVDLVYDVHGPLPTADGRPPLVMIGHPMDASGFQAQVKLFEDRTVVTYDPRGLGRSKRKDGGVTNDPEVQAEDVHAIIEALGAGPVDMLASSGGAVTALALVTAHPDDVSTLVAHEPPIDSVLCRFPARLTACRDTSAGMAPPGSVFGCQDTRHPRAGYGVS